PVRRAGPPELRRLVPAATSEAVVRRQDVIGTEVIAVFEARARDRHRHGRPPVSASPVSRVSRRTLRGHRGASSACAAPDRRDLTPASGGNDGMARIVPPPGLAGPALPRRRMSHRRRSEGDAVRSRYAIVVAALMSSVIASPSLASNVRL